MYGDNGARDSVSELGTFDMTDGAQWIRAVYVPSTKAIYGMPYHASTVLKIDTAKNDTISTIGSKTES